MKFFADQDVYQVTINTRDKDFGALVFLQFLDHSKIFAAHAAPGKALAAQMGV